MLLAAWLLATAPSEPPADDDDFGMLPTFDPGAPTPPDEDTAGTDAKPGPTNDGDEEPGTAVAPAEPPQRFGDAVSGSLRLTGVFLHFDDVPEVFPNSDDGIVFGVGRLLVDEDFDHGLNVELNLFADLSRTVPGGGLTGAFTTAGATDSVYRAPTLTWTFWDSGNMRGTMGLDRFAAEVDAGPVTVQVGRFPVNFSVTGFVTPNDFLAPFSATAVNRIYKPGVDALRLGIAAGTRTSIDVVGVLGYDDFGVPSWGRSAALTRVSAVLVGFEWAALGGKVAERWVLGGSAQGDAGPIGLRAEGHVGVPDDAGDGRDSGDRRRPVHGRLAAGPNVNFRWHSTTLSAEYAFLSDGKLKPGNDPVGRFSRLFPDDVPYLGKHYASAAFGTQIIPVLTGTAFTLIDAGDGSGLAGASLIYNVADEVDIIAGAFFPWGAEPSASDLAAQPVKLGSEFGLSPLSVYLEVRAFF